MGAALQGGRRRLAHGPPARLLLAGAAVTLGVAAAAALGGWAIALASAQLGLAGVLLEALALKATLAVRGLAAAATQVASALDRGDLVAARAIVGTHLVSRPTAGLDATAVASAAIESVAENVTDALVAPLVAYLVLGLPGAAAYRAINTADAMIGYRDGVLEHFGKIAARLDDALYFVPARLAAVALIVAAPLGSGAPAAALATAWREHGRTASPNAGWTMAAMAGALGLVLEKPGHYRLGARSAARRPAVPDIARSVRIACGACALAALGTAIAAAVSRYLPI
jgi:adenosylcobinamide-phosphate synthase